MLNDSLTDTCDPYGAMAAVSHAIGLPLPLLDDQLRFLRLHQQHLVTRHKYEFQGAQLRAFTDTGRSATIAADLLDDLCERGLMEFGIGSADVVLTHYGREYSC